MGASSGYQLVQSLGTGVCGAVYLAEVAGRKVAIRQFISTSPLDGYIWRTERQNFLDGGHRAMALKHPRIVPILEVIDESEAFLAMEYMEAETLRNAMATRTFTMEESNTLLRQVAMALDYAHQHGVVHGDLKPGDIFLDRQGATVSDFGISPRAHLDPTRQTPPALLHPYLSPEHIRNPESVGPRSDQFSLGIIAYQLYTGQSPYGEGVPDLAAAILNSQILQPSRVNRQMPPEIDPVVMRALSPDPAQRFGSCMEFVASLGAKVITQADEVGIAKSRKAIYIAAGLLICAAAGFAYWESGRKPAAQPARVAVAIPPAAPPAELPKPVETKATKSVASIPPAIKSPPSKATASFGRSPFGDVKAEKIPDPPRPRQESNPVVAPVPPPPLKIRPGQCPPPLADGVVTLQVFSDQTQIEENQVFPIDNAKLGRMVKDDLRVAVQSSVKLPGKLTIDWTVKGTRYDSVTMASQQDVVPFGNKPVVGRYMVTLKWNGCELKSFHFEITEPQQ